MLPMVSQCSNPGWLVSLPIQKSTGFLRTKEHDQWNIGLMLVWKAVFLYPILVCEQCSGFSREAWAHMFIIAYFLKKFTCVILELVFYNNGWVRVYLKKIIIVQGYLLINASWQYLFSCPKGETNSSSSNPLMVIKLYYICYQSFGALQLLLPKRGNISCIEWVCNWVFIYRKY